MFASLGEVGGALTEAWDTLRLWSERGIETQLISDRPLSREFRDQLPAIRCTAVESSDEDLLKSLAGSTAVGFCSDRFLELAPRLQERGSRLVWVNCMTWVFAQEREIYLRSRLFDAYLFQGEFQRQELEREYVRFGYEPALGHLIRGYLHLSDRPFEPSVRRAEDDFVVGRLARPDLSKWSRATWTTYGKIDHPRRRGLVMGVDEMVRKWIGPTPDWGEALPPCAISSHDFYRRVHCLLPINFSAFESWPRVGLEAMATGVPIVAPRQGGWVDMIRHGVNGFLADTADELAGYATQLAHDENLRQQIIRQAREMLETELANPDQIWEGWRKLLQLT